MARKSNACFEYLKYARCQFLLIMMVHFRTSSNKKNLCHAHISEVIRKSIGVVKGSF